MVIVFDLDDTLCDTDEYSEKYILEFITEHNLPYRRLTKAVRYAEMKFDWDKETANRWYIKFGDQMMAQFPPKPYAVDLIRALREAGNKVVISTARNIDWHTDPENVTKKWLYEKGFEYDKLYVGRVDKENICEEVGADIFVDDDLDNCVRVAEFFKSRGKGQVYLPNTPYNLTQQAPSDIIRVYDLFDLANLFNINLTNINGL